MFDNSAVDQSGRTDPGTVSIVLAEQPPTTPDNLKREAAEAPSGLPTPQPANNDDYSGMIEVLVKVLAQPLDVKAIAQRLHLSPAHTNTWLKRAVQEGRVEKLTKPVRYVKASTPLSLFAQDKEPTSLIDDAIKDHP